MHAYLKSLEVSNFKGVSAYFARMSPLGVYTYTFGFHSDNLTPFWTVSLLRVDRFIDTLDIKKQLLRLMIPIPHM